MPRPMCVGWFQKILFDCTSVVCEAGKSLLSAPASALRHGDRLRRVAPGISSAVELGHVTGSGNSLPWQNGVSRARQHPALLGTMLLVLWSAIPPAAAVVIEAASGTLGAAGSVTTAVVGLAGSTAWEPAGLEATLPQAAPATPILDPLPADTNILVIANCSTVTVVGNGQLGEWQVRAYDADGGALLASSGVMRRFLSGSNDKGMVTIVHLFENLSGRVRFAVYHRTTLADGGEQFRTYSGNLSVLPLLTVEQDVLNGAMVTTDAQASPLSSAPHPSNWGDVGGASVAVDLDAPGDIFLAASFAGVAGAPNSVGYWRLVDGAGNPVGQTVMTTLVNTGQPSTFAVFGLANNLTTTGPHTFRLQHTVNSGTAMQTSTVSFAAVALSLSDGRRFEAYQASNGGTISNSGSDAPTVVTSQSFTLAEESDILVVSNFEASTTGGMTVDFRVGVDTTYTQYGEFTNPNASGERGGSNSGLVENRTAGPHTAHLELDVVDSTAQQARIPASGSNLVTILLNTAARPGGEADIDLYRAILQTWDNRTVLDTCRARTSSEARNAFESRHVGARIVSLAHIEGAHSRGYRLFLGGVRTAEARNIRDTCWAQNPTQAREIIGERHAGGVVNHMGWYPFSSRAGTWYGVTQRADLFDTLAASSSQEALSAFSQRFWRQHVVAVVKTSNGNGFRTYEGTLDPEEFTVIRQAGSTERAAAAAAAANPRCRVLGVVPHRATDGVISYEARVRASDGRSVPDTCSAESSAEAQAILRHRHGAEGGVPVREIDWDEEYGLFEGAVSGAGQPGFRDATFAKTAAAAHDILRGRYPKHSIGSVTPVTDLGRYREFKGTIKTEDGRSVLDTCWAVNPASARQVFAARFGSGEIGSVTPYGTNRLDEFEVVLKADVTRERCQARDQAEAFRILASRFPETRVVTVRPLDEGPEEAVFQAVLNTPDGRTIVDTIEASGSGEAQKLLLLRHPGSRVTSLQRLSEGRVDDTYQARIDLPPAKDTCQASSPAEARQIFEARYPRGVSSGLRPILRDGD